MKRLLIFYFLFFPVFLLSEKRDVYAISDGKGNIKLFWLTSPKNYPSGGWRIEEEKTNKVIEKQLYCGREEFLNALKEEEKGLAKNFIKIFKDDDKEKKGKKFLIVLEAMTNWNFAQAIGIGYEIKDVPKGKVRYKIIGLDESGKKVGPNFLSDFLDSSVETLPPDAPENLKAEIILREVKLSWSQPKEKGVIPSVFFNVERDGKVLNLNPIIPSGEDSSFLDKEPPSLMEVNYFVYGVDVFGRKSIIKKISIYVPDLKGMVPPENFTAEEKSGKIILRWKKVENSSGYIIERSNLSNSLYEILTPKGIQPDMEYYEDSNLQGGSVYYYRIHSYGRDGKIGPPSLVAFAQAKNQTPPPKPKNLKAKVGRTMVQLMWDRVDFPVAGYRIERKAEGKEKWDRLNEKLTPEPNYNDITGLYTQGKFKYRVIAVAYDEKESLPSEEVEVELLDTVSPNPPRITNIESFDGVVKIYFEPSPPEEDVFNFLIVRGVSEEDPGLVIGEPLSKEKREFEDKFVKIGQRYWYRVVAIDKKGNRSDLSSSRDINVVPPQIPIPEILNLTYIDKPLKHIEIKFKKIEYPFGIVIQKFIKDKWVSISGVIKEGDVFNDIDLKNGVAKYRAFYILQNGTAGKTSKEYEIKIP